VESAEDTAKAINEVLGALAQGLVTLSEATHAIELIERCGRLIEQAAPAVTQAHGYTTTIQFITVAEASEVNGG
jgi:hypothetical protein